MQMIFHNDEKKMRQNIYNDTTIYYSMIQTQFKHSHSNHKLNFYTQSNLFKHKSHKKKKITVTQNKSLETPLQNPTVAHFP